MIVGSSNKLLTMLSIVYVNYVCKPSRCHGTKEEIKWQYEFGQSETSEVIRAVIGRLAHQQVFTKQKNLKFMAKNTTIGVFHFLQNTDSLIANYIC